MLENGVLRRIFGIKKDEKKKKCERRSCMTCAVCQILLEGSSQEGLDG
jgi:hypothetical protein